MILTTTYRQHVEMKRDVLAAFSALDHGVTSEMAPVEIEDAFVRLLLRLATLCLLHGESVPRRLVTELRHCHPETAIDLISAFLEHGDRTVIAGGSELQQEIVHFSRIVDIDPHGPPAEDARALRRLRRSANLPEPLKVLTELLVVARGRLLQRGVALPAPVPPSRRPMRMELGDSIVFQADGNPGAYALALHSTRRRTAMQAAYHFHSLLSYLPPSEAGAALCVHLADLLHKESIGVAIAWIATDARVGGLTWSADAGRTYDNPFQAALSLLPAASSIGPVGQGPGEVHLDGGRGVKLTVSTRQGTVEARCGDQCSVALAAPARAWDGDLSGLGRRAVELLSGRGCGEVRSIECGHVHLDRELDIDQVAGMAIGMAAYEHLTGRQQAPPLVMPMVDDDHVLIRLRPAEYVRFLRAHVHGRAGFRLVLESSPIVRAIAVCLFNRLRGIAPHRLCSRGGNVYVGLPDGGHCELFEGWDGAAANGCVLFETALLVYRSDPERFDSYTGMRFGLPRGIHEMAAAVLDDDQGHDRKVESIRRLYEPFRPLTAPDCQDVEFGGLVQSVLSAAPPVVVHLNVLEDYYEVQQGKVRKLMALMDLPLRLLTLHFSAQTGRVTIDG